MMKILSFDRSPFHTLSYLNVARGGGPEEATLPMYRARVDALPPALEAIVVTSDLQGRAHGRPDGPSPAPLLGEVLAGELQVLQEMDVLPPRDRVGVILAGDLYAVPDLSRRGGFGDVRPVWRALRQSCRWVAGVAGNHDSFGARIDMAHLEQVDDIHVLDQRLLRLDGLTIGGVCGVIGPSGRPWRRSEVDFTSAVDDVVRKRPTLLVLHQPPDRPGDPRAAYPLFTRRLAALNGCLTICGHRPWSEPLMTWPSGAQTLNVDHRVVVLSA